MSEGRERTTSGGILTLITVAAALIIGAHELKWWAQPRIYDDLSVDTARAGLDRTMPITFNLSIQVPCGALWFGAYDFEGNAQQSRKNELHKQRIDDHGVPLEDKQWLEHRRKEMKSRQEKKVEKESQYCGSCYGMKDQGECCNSCDDVIDAHHAKNMPVKMIDRWEQCVSEGYAYLGIETCNVWGSVRVARVAGSLFFALVQDARPGAKDYDISRLSRSTNLSHYVREFHIGPPSAGSANQLDGTAVVQKERRLSVFEYYLTIVPVRSALESSFRFSAAFTKRQVTEKRTRTVPGIYFHYDMAPVQITSRVDAPSLLQFIARTCALVGGAITCAGLLDQFVFRAQMLVAEKKAA